MAINTEPTREVGLRELLAGIIADIQSLVTQQITLVKSEVNDTFARTRDAAAYVAAGLVAVSTGGVLVGLMLAHGLSAYAPQLPLWACYAIVGAPAMAAGGVLCLVGAGKFRSADTDALEINRVRREKSDE